VGTITSEVDRVRVLDHRQMLIGTAGGADARGGASAARFFPGISTLVEATRGDRNHVELFLGHRLWRPRPDHFIERLPNRRHARFGKTSAEVDQSFDRTEVESIVKGNGQFDDDVRLSRLCR